MVFLHATFFSMILGKSNCIIEEGEVRLSDFSLQKNTSFFQLFFKPLAIGFLRLSRSFATQVGAKFVFCCFFAVSKYLRKGNFLLRKFKKGRAEPFGSKLKE